MLAPSDSGRLGRGRLKSTAGFHFAPHWSGKNAEDARGVKISMLCGHRVNLLISIALLWRTGEKGRTNRRSASLFFLYTVAGCTELTPAKRSSWLDCTAGCQGTGG